MRTPDTLTALVDHGIIENVLRPLMSGKEAQIYLVESGGEQRVAKIYKESQDRTFQNRADYTEGRKVRNSRDQRAMGNRSKHGRAQNEAAWKTAEVEMIYRLREAGVRVPVPYNFIDGVLIMELVTDAEGFPAARLGDLTFEPEEATAIFQRVLAEVVRMLCAGVVHGDLSDFNVLLSADGPVIIDFPQAVDASSNQNARKLLLRDVENLHRFHSKFVPGVVALPYAEEMWDLFSRNALTPDTPLTGKFRTAKKVVNTDAVVDLIADAERDERKRREGLKLSMRGVGPETRDARGPAREKRGGAPTTEVYVGLDARAAQAREARGSGQAREGRGPGQGRDGRGAGARDARGPGQARDARGPGQARDARGPGQARDARGAGQAREGQAREGQAREVRSAGAAREARAPERREFQAGDTRVSPQREPGQARDTRFSPQREVREPGQARDTRVSPQRDAGEPRDVRGHGQARDGRAPERDARANNREPSAGNRDARANSRDPSASNRDPSASNRDPRGANERASNRDPRGASERTARDSARVNEPRAPERTADAARQLAQEGLRPAKGQRPSSSWGQRSDRQPGQAQRPRGPRRD